MNKTGFFTAAHRELQIRRCARGEMYSVVSAGRDDLIRRSSTYINKHMHLLSGCSANRHLLKGITQHWPPAFWSQKVILEQPVSRLTMWQILRAWHKLEIHKGRKHESHCCTVRMMLQPNIQPFQESHFHCCALFLSVLKTWGPSSCSSGMTGNHYHKAPTLVNISNVCCRGNPAAQCPGIWKRS